jgi:hypothetical protein
MYPPVLGVTQSSPYDERVWKRFLLLCAVTQVLSQAATVQLLSAGNMNDGTYYVGDVVLAINGVNVAAMCIDFADHSEIGDTWNADLVPFTGAQQNYIVTNFYYPGVTGQQLSEAAFLFQAMQQNQTNTTAVIDIQHAMWDLMSNAGLPDGNWEALAQAEGTNLDLTPYSMAVDTYTGNGREQAFMYSSTVPEPAVSLSLGAGLILIGLLTRRMRKHPRR